MAPEKKKFWKQNQPCRHASMWRGGGSAFGSGPWLQLTDKTAVHTAGGVIPAADGHPRQNLSLDYVAAVFVNVVVGLPNFPEPGERERWRR